MKDIESADKQVQVNNGDLLVFVGLSPANSDALKYSHLFSSLVASSEYFPTTEGQDWFHTYLKTMQTCGWLPIKFKYEKESASSERFAVAQLLVKAVQVGLGFATAGATSAAAALTAIASSAVDTVADNADATALMDRVHSAKEGTSLNMAVCVQHPDGEVLLSVGCVQSEDAPPSTNNYLLFEYTSSQSEMYTGSAALAFHQSLYEQLKDSIIERVADKSKKDVLTMSIVPKKRS
ncbi:hypothetical protein [Pseudomonas sp. H9]|uniref:hypothetical protein n=1 Tax=Pseudomonas sp. H9 TaxID=483968 RepID=UPI001057CEE2|nr:hypothetical protein [Pseudomonas sp. H9]TDF85361.1 hypothetical protein E1573_04830 [Pseudomonas sp. H9]